MKKKSSEIYLAGGCFWGIQKYFAQINGVIKTKTGYANGSIKKPSYEQVCYGNTGFAEAVQIIYDVQKITLEELLTFFYEVVDPTAFHRQGKDIGSQYRTGIYYTMPQEEKRILDSIEQLQQKYEKAIQIEVLPLTNFYPAEEYHQNYLEKHPTGYCHISQVKFEQAKEESKRKSLTDLQYEVTQKNATEPPFLNEYWDHYQKGIYVDVVSGEPLFLSLDKFESECGWPSFSKPMDKKVIEEKADLSHHMIRTEVRSKKADSHLGHVFKDGPKELGGLRYCINSASLRFISFEELEKEGYGEYKKYFQTEEK